MGPHFLYPIFQHMNTFLPNSSGTETDLSIVHIIIPYVKGTEGKAMNSVHPLNINSAKVFLMLRNPSLLKTLLKIVQKMRSLHLSLFPTSHCYISILGEKNALLPPVKCSPYKH